MTILGYFLLGVLAIPLTVLALGLACLVLFLIGTIAMGIVIKIGDKFFD